MRYEKGQKATTRRQILETASRCFRRDGVSAAGIAGIMSEAGLTNGAFYTHFASKEELVRDALAEALDGQQRRLEEDLHAGLSLEAVIRGYLNPDHLKAPEIGCPSAALLPEIARQPQPTREAYEQGLSRYVSLLAGQLENPDSAAAHRRATAIFALMVGTLEFARAVADTSRAEKILEGGIEAALLLADAQFA
ncbi:TetR/AcrR family transcriptional regulator [Dyella japonica]|uniref:AcrR family transcriptional regulator n=1 Tax=Dyella japonica TaxID=231455 RepID=A0ABV2K0P6_9GAMM